MIDRNRALLFRTSYTFNGLSSVLKILIKHLERADEYDYSLYVTSTSLKLLVGSRTGILVEDHLYNELYHCQNVYIICEMFVTPILL